MVAGQWIGTAANVVFDAVSVVIQAQFWIVDTDMSHFSGLYPTQARGGPKSQNGGGVRWGLGHVRVDMERS